MTSSVGVLYRILFITCVSPHRLQDVMSRVTTETKSAPPPDSLSPFVHTDRCSVIGGNVASAVLMSLISLSVQISRESSDSLEATAVTSLCTVTGYRCCSRLLGKVCLGDQRYFIQQVDE